MISPIRNFIDRMRGNGRHAITTPPMDGVLQPNNLIEDAALLAEVTAPDNLARAGGEVFVTSGTQMMKLSAGGVETVAGFPDEINAVAASPGGALAIVFANGRVLIRGGAHDGLAIENKALTCGTAVCFAGEDTVYVCQGSDRNPLSEWKRDLMERNALGSVWKIELAAGAFSRIAGGLAFPYGILARDDASLVVAESWRSRLITFDGAGNVRSLLQDLPGYPARLMPRADGRGVWLSLFAPRSQLIEFVLREDKFREDMLRSIPSDLWMAPSLTAPHSFLEPLQGGGLKQLGVMKPWAPTRSFGLVISLDENLEPVASWHSRADGVRHGITSIVDRGDGVIAASKGGNALVFLVQRGGMPA